MQTVTLRDENGRAVGILVLSEKTFSSGKVGYYGQGKVTIAGKRYQCQCQAVMIGGQDKAQNGE